LLIRWLYNAGDAVIISMSQWPVPTVCSPDPSRDWFTGVREGLGWNQRLVQHGAGQ
jgi:NAD+ kinase